MDERRRRLIVLGVMLSIFLAAMESTVVSTAMPRVVASLGGIEMYSWVFSGFLLTSTVTMPVDWSTSKSVCRISSVVPELVTSNRRVTPAPLTVGLMMSRLNISSPRVYHFCSW